MRGVKKGASPHALSSRAKAMSHGATTTCVVLFVSPRARECSAANSPLRHRVRERLAGHLREQVVLDVVVDAAAQGQGRPHRVAGEHVVGRAQLAGNPALGPRLYSSGMIFVR